MSARKTYKPIILTEDPLWLPAELRYRKEDLQVKFRFSEAERRIYRKRKRMPVSQWTERHRIVTMSSMPGRWKNNITPYLAGIMDASFFSSVETTIICAAPQVGKSECVNNCIGYAIDRMSGPVLYVYPDENTARENSRDRILPMITSSRRLKSYLTGAQDDEAALRINLQHMPIYMAWARSASRLANKPIKYLVFDETDKYPLTAGLREADPISLGEKRARTYLYGRKIWKLSTPTTESGPIWQALIYEAQVIFDYWVCCPDCGTMQRMEFKQIKWPEEERNPEKVFAENLAWYECANCKSKWNDYKRDVAVRWGKWQDREKGLELMKYLDKYRPMKIGFHIPSWLSHFVKLSEIAASFLKGLKDKNKLKDFNNNYAAEPWLDYMQEREEEKILMLRDDRPRGLVPSGQIVAAMTAGVDTQDDGFWYEIRAWGWGQDPESWQIREGFVTTFEALDRVLFQDVYVDSDEKEYRIQRVVHDAMGHRTSEIYDYSRRHPNFIWAFKGEQRMTQPYKWSKIDVYPGSNRPIPGGLRLLRADVNYFKNVLARKLEIAPADPGAWHFHSETTEAWARHMCAEYVNEKGFWQCPDSKANHGWDCSIYNLIAADVLGVKYMKKEGHKKKMPPARKKRFIEDQKNWFRKE